MAEYIDKKHLDRKFQIDMMCLRGGTIFDTKKIIDSLPTADVIERPKIDKAIAETYKIRQGVLHNDNKCYEPNDVLDIIDEISAYFERIIGE